jgi:tRNA 5-methylaminomethyl-2-thiouridine biosynthesis bifunctional protein
MNVEEAVIEIESQSVYNKRFDDIYFSAQGGLDEKRYVFIAGNRLPPRWQHKNTLDTFVIAEMGFGLGLNFLATWQEWDKHTEKKGTLHYITIEQYPVEARLIVQIKEWWPELGYYANQLLQHYHKIHVGEVVRIEIAEDVVLTLLCGSVQAMLPHLNCPVDAWYLDGFSPAKNPDMWSEKVFDAMHANTRHQGTVATYTASSSVQRGLKLAGFDVQKTPGYGHKREMLTGVFG